MCLQQKIFGVGFPKTGTTSLESALKILGYKVWYGHWENPNMSYIMALQMQKDYDELFRIINYYDAFADAPWGGSRLYLELYKRLPRSKFILTTRSPEDWYISLERMLTKFSPNSETATALSTFHAMGRYGIVHFFERVFDIKTLEGNKLKIIDYYNTYNQEVIDFFEREKANFLVYDLSDDKKWEKICAFLDKPIPHQPFPHANKSQRQSPRIGVTESVTYDLNKKNRIIKSTKVNVPVIAKVHSFFLGSINVLKQLSAVYTIGRSSFFDKSWYLEHNPDVAKTKKGQAWHYLRFGGFEGRDPSPKFSSSWYLNTYEDVQRVGMNPLLHYIRYGRKEGRIPRQRKPATIVGVIREDSASFSKIQKVFCIGLNKTGTTSIAQALRELGYIVGVQSEAEQLMDDWVVRDFQRIIRYCETADAFQDVPFSLDFTYQVLDFVFPNSKFILTVRDSAEDWYQSLVRFHSNLLGVNGVPTVDDLKNFTYHERGYLWKHQKSIFGVDETTLYDERIYKAHYKNHNAKILEYFKFRPDDLLVLNLSEQYSMQSLCNFLGVEYTGQIMPHLNQSKQ